MRRLASFVAILLLLLTAAPVLACATDAGLTHEERACCRAMHGDCGEMAKTGCCRTEFRADTHPQQVSVAPQIRLAQILVVWMAPVAKPAPSVPPAILRAPDEHSPPGLLIAKLTVLRI